MPRKRKDGESKTEQEHDQEQEQEEDEEEYASATPRISFTDLEKSMTTFSRDDAYGIETWITEFEDIASLMEWSDLEKLIYSKRLLSGTARLFLRSLQGVTKWNVLKKELREEFCSSLNSAALHKRLASRKMKTNETYQQYFLHMKEIAILGSIEDEALMEYVIDGIRDTESNKSILYGASNMKEFRKKLELYGEIRKKIDAKMNNSNSKPSPSPSTSKGYRPKPKIRCYNCGSTDHMSKDCTKGVKCFKCNNFGHKSTECRNKEKQQLKIQEKDKDRCVTPYKDVYINNVSIKALIDTGSDVNLVKESYADKIDCKSYNHDSVLCLKGIADHEIHTIGSFMANIQIDDCYFDTTIHVVKNDSIPVNVILGNPILKDVEVNFSPEGISARRVMHLTTLEDFKENSMDVAQKGCKDEIKTVIQDKNSADPEKESSVELKIILDNETPILQNPRCISPLEFDTYKFQSSTQTSEWLKADIIAQSKSDSASPVVLAKKKNGLYQMRIDYKRPNKRIKKKDLPSKVARWALLLEKYDYTIEHRPGIRMKHADALRRCPIKNVYTDIASQIRNAQDEDLKLKLIKKLLDTEPYEDHVIENGILCKVEDGNKLIVVPKKIQTEIIQKNQKIEELIPRKYYIDHMKEKVKAVTNNCIECILTSRKRRKKKDYLPSTYHINHRSSANQMKPWLVAEDSAHSSETDE